MAPVIIDLAPWAGREIRVRVVDAHAGGAWGHVNFDDVKFCSTRPIHACAVEVKSSQMPRRAVSWSAGGGQG